jgi:hypothetical protein
MWRGDPDSVGFDIIVVDNGSTDRTCTISRELGITTLVKPGITVGALRNSGAMVAKGQVLVFLDADISLTPEWIQALPGLLAKFQQKGPFVSGSKVHAHGRRTMIDRAWFTPDETEGGERYVNSGHLIVPKSLFATIGGFDETLVSGEDSEFCERARGLGFEILPVKEMIVIHRGTPKTIREFFRRERSWLRLPVCKADVAIKTSHPGPAKLHCLSCRVPWGVSILVPGHSRVYMLPDRTFGRSSNISKQGVDQQPTTGPGPALWRLHCRQGAVPLRSAS